MNKAVELLKLSVAVAAALIAGAASAANSFSSGSLTLTESQDVAAIASLSNWGFSTPPDSTSTAAIESTPGSAGYYALLISQPLTGATFGADGSLTDVVAGGSGLTITNGSNYSTFSNIEVDFASGQLFADVVTESASYGRQKLFDVSSVANAATVLPDGSVSIDLSAASVVLPPQPDKQTYAPWFSNLIPSGIAAPTSPVLFGSLSGNVVASVPEPSTYVLMALGLCGAGCVARRRVASAA